jgi:hypothetical protein
MADLPALVVPVRVSMKGLWRLTLLATLLRFARRSVEVEVVFSAAAQRSISDRFHDMIVRRARQ